MWKNPEKWPGEPKEEAMTATATPMIYAALAAAAKEIGAVGKDKENVQQNYKFRGIDAVVNAVHPVFTKHGIVTALKVVDQKREERQTKNGGTLLTSLLMCEITFYATDGSSVVCGALGEGMDSGDKASNKAMSAALKYALTQTLMIPFEVHDSEDDNPEPVARSPQPRPQERPAPAPVENGPADNRARPKPAPSDGTPRYWFSEKRNVKNAVLAGWDKPAGAAKKEKFFCVVDEMDDRELQEAWRTCKSDLDYCVDNNRDTKYAEADLDKIEAEMGKRGIQPLSKIEAA